MDTEKAIRHWEETERLMHERNAGYEKDPSTMRMDPFRLFGNLFYVGDKAVCSHLLDTGDGLILFDSGFPHAAAQLFERITSLGFGLQDIKYVIHTHEHFDHFGATRRLQARYGCKTFIHEYGAATFRLYPHHTELQSARSPEASLFIPDSEFSDGDVIRLGEAEILCVHTPGHSAGSTTFFFTVEEDGRVLRVGLCGVNGLLTLHPGRLLKYGIPLSAGEDYLASIERIRTESVDIALDTHPRLGGVIERRASMVERPGTNPFIDRDAWRDNLDEYRARYLESRESLVGKI